MGINFLDLKRKEIRRVIETEDKEHPILIYNPTKEQKKLIIDLLLSNISKEDLDNEKTVKPNINGYDIILTLLPELTNVDLSLDVNDPEHKELIENIINDPSDELLDIRDEINKIVNRQFIRYYEYLKELTNMPEELRKIHLEQFDEDKVSEE
jgi:hypothetical protein